ncbi:MAG: class I SAM-dependent methyltransferase, partial [Candidatus Sericytochromatia bacterium]|nr:class I SAM-dependent methyltransferase [Candidatus Sericytochromatia bacterium]
YDKTLLAWNDNFQKSWSQLEKSYSPRFKRMWEFYLLQVAGVFRARNQQLWQIILTHPGTKQLDYRK